MKQVLGVTFNEKAGQQTVGVYIDENGAECFVTDEPYLLSDGTSLTEPLPIRIVDGPYDTNAPLMMIQTPSEGGGVLPVFDSTPTPYAVFALQRVRSAYTGPIVTLRRAGDSAEQAFSAGSNGLLSRAAIVAWAGTQEVRVKTWHDQMGAHDATQTTAANQPIFDWSGGSPMIYNFSTPHSLVVAGALGFGRNQPGLVVAGLGDGVGTPTTTAVLTGLRPGPGTSQIDLRSLNTGKWASFMVRNNAEGSAIPTSALAAGEAGWTSAIAEAVFATNAPAITVNGTRTVSGTFGSSGNSADADATDAPRIGAQPNAGNPWLGFYRAIAYFQGNLDAAGRTAVTAALDYLKPAALNRYIACWGDSLTAGGYPVYLRTMFDLNRQVHDGGVGGESAASIRARQVANYYYDARINLLEGGRNGFKTVPAADIKADMDLMIAHVKGGRWLVGSVSPWTTDTVDNVASRLALNALYQSSYGERYHDWVPAVQAANDGSQEDLSDIANGWLPRSVRSDEGHLNAIGQQAKAASYRDKLLSLGW